MKDKKRRIIAAVLGVSLFLVTCTGCSAIKTLENSIEGESPRVVTIENGKKMITVEDMGNKTIAQILEEANITLKDGDVLVVDPDSENLALRVLHRVTVTVVDAASAYPEEIERTIVLFGATVKDAVVAAGFEWNDKLELNFSADSELKDEMRIVISDPANAKEAEGEDAASDGSSDGNSKGSSKNNPGGGNSKPKPSNPPASPTKTVVSIVKYEDCDGSGHGVKVITYSDGSQQEIPY